MIITPKVNINGTSAQSLLEQNIQAAEAVQVALEALYKAAPHGRDYQTAHPTAFHEAQYQHSIRVSKLQSVLKELNTIIMDIYHPAT